VEWLWEFCYGSPNYRTTSTYKSLSIKTTQYIFIVSGFEGGFNTAFSRRCIQAAMVQWFQKQTTNLFVERRGSIGGCVSGSYTLMHIGNLLRPSFLQTEQFLECFKKNPDTFPVISLFNTYKQCTIGKSYLCVCPIEISTSETARQGCNKNFVLGNYTQNYRVNLILA